MIDRVRVVVPIALLAIGAIAVAVVARPADTYPRPSRDVCPAPVSEADAVDTFRPGLAAAARAWSVTGDSPATLRPGRIAAFAWNDLSGPQSVITIDPATGMRCTLVTFVEKKPIRARISQLDWSPSGDALAIGIENSPLPEAGGDPNGHAAQVLIWTPGRLLRVWSGPGQTPGLEWAPDGRSIAVWIRYGVDSSNTQVLQADGSPDRFINVNPSGDALHWSPDGTRWVLARIHDPATSFAASVVATVGVEDGRVAPIDLGIHWLSPEGWLDNERVLLSARAWDQAEIAFLDVPLAAPETFAVVPLPGAALHPDRFVVFSPDGGRAAYVTADGELEIAELRGLPGGSPIRLETGPEFRPGLAWAHDGSKLVFTQVVPSTESTSSYAVWTVNADGTGLREIAVGNLWAMDDPWQPVPAE